MADKRIIELTQAFKYAADDFVEKDGATGGSLKVSPFDVHGQFRNALSARGGVSFDGSTSDSKVRATLAGLSIDTGVFSRSIMLRVPTSNPSVAYSLDYIGPSATTVAVNSQAVLSAEIGSTGSLVIYLGSASGTNRATIANVVANYGGKVLHILFVRNSSGNPDIYFNGVAQSPTFTTTGTPPTWQGTITSTYLGFGYQTPGANYLFSGVFYGASLFSSALAAADALEIFELGGEVPDRLKANCTLHLPANDGGGYVLRDASGNGRHAQMTAAGVTHFRGLSGPFRVRRSSSTNGNEQLFGQVCIPANAQILRVRAKSRSGTPSVTLGTASGGAQVVASVSLSSAWKDLTIALTGGMVGGSDISLWAGSNSTDIVDWDVTWEPLSA